MIFRFHNSIVFFSMFFILFFITYNKAQAENASRSVSKKSVVNLAWCEDLAKNKATSILNNQFLLELYDTQLIFPNRAVQNEENKKMPIGIQIGNTTFVAPQGRSKSDSDFPVFNWKLLRSQNNTTNKDDISNYINNGGHSQIDVGEGKKIYVRRGHQNDQPEIHYFLDHSAASNPDSRNYKKACEVIVRITKESAIITKIDYKTKSQQTKSQQEDKQNSQKDEPIKVTEVCNLPYSLFSIQQNTKSPAGQSSSSEGAPAGSKH